MKAIVKKSKTNIGVDYIVLTISNIIILLILNYINYEVYKYFLYGNLIYHLYMIYEYSKYIEDNSKSCFDNFFHININENQKVAEIFIAKKNLDIKLNIRMNYIYFYIDNKYIGKKGINNSSQKELLINFKEHENKLIEFAFKKINNLGMISDFFKKDTKLIKIIKKSNKMVFKNSYICIKKINL